MLSNIEEINDQENSFESPWKKYVDNAITDEVGDVDSGRLQDFCTIANSAALPTPGAICWDTNEKCFMVSFHDFNFFITVSSQILEVTKLPGPLVIEFDDSKQCIQHILKNKTFYMNPNIVHDPKHCT